MFCAYVFGSDWYLFYLIVLLKPDFNYWNNFALSWADKVTIGTKSFVSVILNYVSPVAEETTNLQTKLK